MGEHLQGRGKPVAGRGYWLLVLAIAFSCVAAATATRPAGDAKGTPRYRFDGNTVRDLARRTASSAFVQKSLDNSALQQLTYDQYRDIRFKTDASIWRNEQVPFRVELFPAGFLFTTPTVVSVVEGGLARDLAPGPNAFVLGGSVAKQLANQPLPLSGFRVRTRLNSRSVWDEFLVFQGASYFRSVARDTLYGLSARGLAVRTAHPAGEEFPAFTHFWIERPTANAAAIVVHALLDSPSVAGAYRFSVTPGIETLMDVDVTLFPRVALDNIGIAPLTSMFLFDEIRARAHRRLPRRGPRLGRPADRDGFGRARLAAAQESHAAAGFQLHFAGAARLRAGAALAARVRLSRPRSALRAAAERLDRADQRLGRGRRAAVRDPDQQRDQRQRRDVLASDRGDRRQASRITFPIACAGTSSRS